MSGRWAVGFGDVVEMVSGSPELLVVDVWEDAIGAHVILTAYQCPKTKRVHESEPCHEFAFKVRRRAQQP